MKLLYLHCWLPGRLIRKLSQLLELRKMKEIKSHVEEFIR